MAALPQAAQPEVWIIQIHKTAHTYTYYVHIDVETGVYIYIHTHTQKAQTEKPKQRWQNIFAFLQKKRMTGGMWQLAPGTHV